VPRLWKQTCSQSRNSANPLLPETAVGLYELWALVLWKADQNPMNDKWDLRFLNLAKEVATWSKDPSTKVGCVIVEPETNRIMGVGFNGFPRGMVDNKELYEDRETKYARTIHAEANAVLNSQKTEGCTAYVTHPPCTNCALVLIQSGISRVVAWRPSADLLSRWSDSLAKSEGFFAEVEVEFELIDGQRN
jgi:dCMP deaminase